MKGFKSFKLLSIILVLAYLLSACSGAAVESGVPAGGKSQAMEVAFTGTVEAIGASEITVSGQIVAIDAKTILDPNVKVGDIVKVEASVSDTGAVLALTIESSSPDDTTTNSGNTNDDNTNSGNTNTNDNSNTSNDNTNSNDNSTGNDNGTGGMEEEITGVVEEITADSVTVDGVTYNFSSFTEFGDAIFVGDEVKLEVIVNADGTFTVREIEKFDGTSIGNDNSNDDDDDDDDSNGNSNDDDDEDDDNSNGNSNGNSNDDD